MITMRVENDPLNNLISDFLSKKQNIIGIEIGSYRGESTELFIKSGAFSRLYCIDPWIPGYDPNDPAATTEIKQAEKEFDERFKDNLTVVKIRQSSDASVGLFDDCSIDFVYIDGDHRFEYVRRDLLNYFPKVKHGGFIAGHDYHPAHPGVILAVNEVFKTVPARLYPDYSWIYIKA